MSSKLSCNLARPPRAISSRVPLIAVWVAACFFVCVPQATAGNDAPSWMHALAGAPLPSYDEKTNAALLYSETNVTVVSTEKIRTRVREAYKILRPEGRNLGVVRVYFNPQIKVTSLHGWCIPAQGKDYEVKDKDVVEAAPNVEGGELVSDVRVKLLRIPAPDPGNIIGYEFDEEEQPLVLQHRWDFQRLNPVRESHYSLQLPPGWEYKAAWLNHPEVQPTPAGNNLWQWTVSDVKEVRREAEMPPFEGVLGQMVVSLLPPGGWGMRGFSNWEEMGTWLWNLEHGRSDASSQIKQQVAALTSGKNTTLQKMQALAEFVQHDIRYVAIELGIGGWQPHPAPDVYFHRYGDCKDKATLMKSMLEEIGVDSYEVLINIHRGSITPQTPAYRGFDHQIIAVRLPEEMRDQSLIATWRHPKYGNLLFFDPTDELIPFGQIPGYLQANYGLLVTPDGGDLVELPQQPSSLNSIRRSAKLTLDPAGKLTGEVSEVRFGNRASAERWRLRSVTSSADRIKPIETLLAGSLSSFRITKASVLNLDKTDLPFGFNYSFESESYAKDAGGLLLVRPRVIGVKANTVLETKEPRRFPIEFEGTFLDTDTFEIAMPPGYEVDDLPPPVDADFGFASYHAKSEINGNVIRYTRTFEVKELSVPVGKAEELKKFYRIIANDERNTAVLKLAAK